MSPPRLSTLDVQLPAALNFRFVYPLVFLVGASVLAGWQVLGHRAPLWSSLLHAVVFFNIGLQGIFAFVGHTFKADESADRIGWPRANPFQTEVAFANLAFGVSGTLIYAWPGGDYLVAVLLGRTVFLYGAVYTHLREYALHKNKSPFNTGTLIYFSVALPILWWSLFFAQKSQ